MDNLFPFKEISPIKSNSSIDSDNPFIKLDFNQVDWYQPSQ